MQEWLNKKRDWTVYLMSKNNGHYVGITSKTMKDRLKRHKKFAEKPTSNTLLANQMRRIGSTGWEMKALTRLHGNYYAARKIERSYMHLSNLNESLNPY